MIVKIDAVCFAVAARPSKNEPPLLIDPNGMEAREVAAELLEVIARGYTQVPIVGRVVEHLKSAKQPTFEIGRDVSRLDVIDEKSP
jgi:hypothetical protein